MPKNDTDISNEESEIIKQIGQWIPVLYNTPRRLPRKAHLMESFDVWKLDIDKLEDAIKSGRIPEDLTDYQHHQLRIDGRVQAYALSQKTPSGSSEVVKMALSRNAKKIDRAIDYLDKEVQDDSITRLLVIRDYSVYTFWLKDRREVYVFSAPSRFKRLRRHRLLPEADFLRDLQSEIKSSEPRQSRTRRQRQKRS